MRSMKKSESRVELESAIEDQYHVHDITIDHDNLLEGAKLVVSSIFPEWKDNKKRFKQFTAGLTNKIYYCEIEGTDQQCLVRVYGKKTEVLIDREQELVNLVTLSKTPLGPKLYGRFNNGYCYGFLKGLPISVPDMKDPHIMSLTARFLHTWHNTHVSGINTPLLWPTLEKWLSIVPEKFSDPEKAKRFNAECSHDWIKSELAELRVVLDKLNSPIVFAHNDLLSKNILYDAEEDCVWFIDYEYATYSYRGFDIGNHFCEFAGMEEPLDFAAYPNKEEQMVFLKEYLENGNEAVSTEDLEALYVEVNQFSLVCHFYWAFWAFIQAESSDIDYDYLGFGLQRLGEYKARKEEFLALRK